MRHPGAPAVAFDPGVNIGQILDSFAIGGVYTILPISGYPRNEQVPFGPIHLVYNRSPEAEVYADRISRHPTGIDLPAGLPVRVLAEGAVTSTFTDAFKNGYCQRPAGVGDPYCNLAGYTYSIHGLVPGPGVLSPYESGTGLKVYWAMLGSAAFIDYPLAEFFRGPVPVTAGSPTSELFFTRTAGCCNRPPHGDAVYSAWETYAGRWRFGAVVDDSGRVEYGEPPLLTMTGPKTDAAMTAPADFTLQAADGGALADVKWWFIEPQHNTFDGVFPDSTVAEQGGALIVPAYSAARRSKFVELPSCAGVTTCRYQALAAGAVVAQARMTNGATWAARALGDTPPVSRVQIKYAGGTPLLADSTPLILPDSLLRNASIIGSAPVFGKGLWPDSLRFEVSVVVSHGTPLPNRQIRLQVTPIDAGGTSVDAVFGHKHIGAGTVVKEAGRLSSTFVTTSEVGIASVTFRPTIVSGPVILRATSPGAEPMVDTIWVGVPGLVQLVPSVTFDTVKNTVIHPSSNWVTPTMHTLLLQLADSFSATYHKKLGYNDASLPFGGKFDLRSQWSSPDSSCWNHPAGQDTTRALWGCHQRHRLGRDVDMRTNNLSPVEIGFLRRTWLRLAAIESRKEGNHDHLPFRR